MIHFCPTAPSAFQGINPLATSGSITICESNHRGLFCRWPAEDWWRERPGVRTDTPVRCRRDGANPSAIIRLVSLCTFFLLPLLNDGIGNEKWGPILKYQFPGWSRVIYGLSVSFVILHRFDLRVANVSRHLPFLHEYQLGARFLASKFLSLF